MPCPVWLSPMAGIDQQQRPCVVPSATAASARNSVSPLNTDAASEPPSASRDRESIRFVAIRNDRRNRPEDLQVVDHLSVDAVAELQERGRHKRSLGGIRIDRRERLRPISNRRLSA